MVKNILLILLLVMAASLRGLSEESDAKPAATIPQEQSGEAVNTEQSLEKWNRLLNRYEGVYDEDAVVYCKNIIELARENQLKKELAYGYSRLGEVYNFLQEDSLAIAAYNNAAELYSRQGLRDSLKNIYTALVELHRLSGNTPEAIDRQKSLLELTEFFGEKESSAIAKRELATLLARQKSYNQAIQLLHSSEAYFEKQADTTNLISNKQLLATIYHNNGNTNEALSEINTAIEILRKSENEKKALLHFQKSLLLIELGYEAEGIVSLQKTLEMAHDDNANQLVAKISGKLVEMFEHNSNYQKALEYHKVLMKSREALLTQSGAEAISVIGKQMKMKSLSQNGNGPEPAMSEAQNKAANPVRIVNLAALGLITLLIIYIVWLIIRNKKLKKDLELEQNEISNAQQKIENIEITKPSMQVYSKVFSKLRAYLTREDQNKRSAGDSTTSFSDQHLLIEAIEIIEYLIKLKLGEVSLKNQDFELDEFIRKHVEEVSSEKISFEIDSRLYKNYSFDLQLLTFSLRLLIQGTSHNNVKEKIKLLVEPVGENLNYVNISAGNLSATEVYENNKLTEKNQFSELSPDQLEQTNNVTFLLLNRIAIVGGGRFRVIKALDNHYIFSLIIPLRGTE